MTGPGGAGGPSGPIRLGLVTGLMLLLLAAVGLATHARYSSGPSAQPTSGGGAVGLDLLGQLVLVVGLATAELILVYFLISFPWKEIPHVGEHGVKVPNPPWLVRLRLAAVAFGMLAIPVLVLLLTLHRRTRPPPPRIAAAAGASGHVPTVRHPAVNFALVLPEATALAVILLLVIGVVLALRRPRLRRWLQLGPATPEEDWTANLEQALASGLAELARPVDPRRAVIAAYAAMEAALLAKGLGRSRVETPLEYLTRLMAGLKGSRSALASLTELYQTARFSPHPVDEGMRLAAEGALSSLRDQLRT